MSKKRKIRIFTAAVSGLVVLAGIAFILVHLFFLRGGKDIFTVNEKNDLTYLVYQKNNPYIDEAYLGPDQNYLSSYTDYIAISNRYTADLSEITDVSYNHRMLITLIARYNKSTSAPDNPAIMHKEFAIESQAGTETTSALALDTNYKLRLEKYRREFQDFAETVELTTVGEIRVDFVTDIHGEGFESTLTRSMTVPLSTEFYNITLSGDESAKTEYNVPVYNLALWAQLAVAAAVIASAWVLFVTLKRLFNHKSVFRQTIDSYLHSYDDIIINAETAVDIWRYESVRLKSFKELVQLATRLNLPVIFIDERHVARFYVTNGNIIYIFEMADTDAIFSAPRLGSHLD